MYAVCTHAMDTLNILVTYETFDNTREKIWAWYFHSWGEYYMMCGGEMHTWSMALFLTHTSQPWYHSYMSLSTI